MWRCITLKNDWGSPLPERYLAAPPAPPAGPRQAPVGGIEAPSTDPRRGDASRCLPYEEAFTPYRRTGERVRDVVKRSATNNQPVPLNDAGNLMCISYHIKGICNTRCGRASDHCPHNAAETGRLLGWCLPAFESP
jgi:hypothetical protein